MSKDRIPITFDEIKVFKNSLHIGQKVEIINSDGMWEAVKRKQKAVIYEKHKHVFCVRYVTSGIKECFTYIQMLLGEGPWLV